jgi:DNA polymerase-3 subunit gamma/tau
VLDYEYYFRLTDAVLEGNVREAILILNEILGKGFDGQNIITGLASHFRDLLVCKDESTLVLFEVGSSIRDRYKEMAKRCSDTFLFKAIELTNGCDLNYRVSRNKRLLMELTLIQLCQLVGAAHDESKKKGLIEPLPPQQPSTSTTQPAPSEKKSPSVVTTQVPPHVVTQPAPTTAEPAKKRSSRPQITISLKEISTKKDKEEEVPKDTFPHEVMNASFTAEDLVRAWDAYLETIQEKVYLKNTMINCKPVLQEDAYFEVVVYNPGQQDELASNSIDMLSFLRGELKNTQIQMRVRIVEPNEKHLAYTSTERYEHLLKQNPLVARLKDEFNLRLD